MAGVEHDASAARLQSRSLRPDAALACADLDAVAAAGRRLRQSPAGTGMAVEREERPRARRGRVLRRQQPRRSPGVRAGASRDRANRTAGARRPRGAAALCEPGREPRDRAMRRIRRPRIGRRSGRARLCGLPRGAGHRARRRPVAGAAPSARRDRGERVQRRGGDRAHARPVLAPGRRRRLAAGRSRQPGRRGARRRCRLGAGLAPAAAGLARGPASLCRARQRPRCRRADPAAHRPGPGNTDCRESSAHRVSTGPAVQVAAITRKEGHR